MSPEEIKKEFEKLNVIIGDHTSRIRQLETTNDALSKALEIKKSELLNVTTERDELAKQVTKLEEQNKSLETEITTLRSTNPSQAQLVDLQKEAENWRKLAIGPLKLTEMLSEDEKPDSDKFYVELEGNSLKYAVMDFGGKIKRGCIDLKEQGLLSVINDDKSLNMEKLNHSFERIFPIVFGEKCLTLRVKEDFVKIDTAQKTIEQLKEEKSDLKKLIDEINSNQKLIEKAYQYFRYEQRRLADTPKSLTLWMSICRKNLEEERLEIARSLSEHGPQYSDLLQKARKIVRNCPAQGKKPDLKRFLEKLSDLIKMADDLISEIDKFEDDKLVKAVERLKPGDIQGVAQLMS